MLLASAAWLLCALVVLAPLPWGAVPSWAEAALQAGVAIAGLLVAVHVARGGRPGEWRNVPRAGTFLGAVFFVCVGFALRSSSTRSSPGEGPSPLLVVTATLLLLGTIATESLVAIGALVLTVLALALRDPRLRLVALGALAVV